jgi:glycerophosphoryl diester phosphodiesterase
MTILFLLIIIICTIFWFFLSSWKPQAHTLFKNNKPTVFGHRGCPIRKTENTLPSFKEALTAGTDGIELDIQWSKDKQLVVFHDFDLTSLGHPEKLVSSLTYEEIKQLSSQFYDKPSTYIPLLQEVVQILPQNQVINIEIKTNQIFCSGIEQEVANLIKNSNIEAQTLISSFNPFVLKKIKQIIPNVKTGLLWSREDQSYWFLPRHWAYFCKPDTFHPDIEFVSEKQVNWAHEKGMLVFAFTVNSSEQINKVKSYNIDGIFTDDPKTMKEKLVV